MTWKERIMNASFGAGFHSCDKEDSSSWASCAVGEKLAFTGDKALGFSVELGQLGIDFKNAVYDNRAALAFVIYREIEAYVKENQKPCMI